MPRKKKETSSTVEAPKTLEEITLEQEKALEELRKEKEGPRMSPGLYWEWRCTIEEMKTAQLNEKRVQLERDLLSREIENKKLRLALFKDTLKSADAEVGAAKTEYQAMKERIEKEIGMSLDGCVISDMTYEVKKLD